MYLQELSLKNIKGFHEAQLRFPEPKHTGNWHVILGNNGTGKTTILQAIALSLVDAHDLLEHPQDWVRQDTQAGECTVKLLRTKSESAIVETKYSVLRPAGNGDVLVSKDSLFHRETPSALSGVLRRGASPQPFLIAGYGALRRMDTGGSKSRRRPTLEVTVRSLFDHSYELADLEDWLMRLDFKRLDHNAKLKRMLREQSKIWAVEHAHNAPFSTLPLDPAKVIQLFEFIVRGLAFHHFHVCLDRNAKVEVMAMTDAGRSFIDRYLYGEAAAISQTRESHLWCIRKARRREASPT